MKQVLTFVLVASLLVGCAHSKYMLTDAEFNKSPYCVQGTELCFITDTNRIVIGHIDQIEHELYGGKITKELSVSITDINHYNEEVMMYLNTLENGKAKIEIQLDEQR